MNDRSVLAGARRLLARSLRALAARCDDASGLCEPRPSGRAALTTPKDGPASGRDAANGSEGPAPRRPVLAFSPSPSPRVSASPPPVLLGPGGEFVRPWPADHSYIYADCIEF